MKKVDGMITLYHKRTGIPHVVRPIDSQEILRTSDLYTTDPNAHNDEDDELDEPKKKAPQRGKPKPVDDDEEPKPKAASAPARSKAPPKRGSKS